MLINSLEAELFQGSLRSQYLLTHQHQQSVLRLQVTLVVVVVVLVVILVVAPPKPRGQLISFLRAQLYLVQNPLVLRMAEQSQLVVFHTLWALIWGISKGETLRCSGPTQNG